MIHSLRKLRQFHWLSGITLSVTACFLLPIIIIVSFIFVGGSGIWSHLWDTVLGDYVGNSIVLMLGVAVGVLLLGLPTAWLTSLYRFPGQRFFTWALLLPLAFPAYIIAYTYTGVLDASGSVQVFLREMTGWQYGEYWFFEIRSMGGAIIMMSLVLYPYVYLLARATFLKQSANIINACRIAGYSRGESWLKVGLPMARPAIITGLTLALMETLADFGTVQYFGVSTFTTGIYRTFYGFGETGGAAKLAAVLLGFVILLILLERYSRGLAKYDTKSLPIKPIQLKRQYGLLAFVVCLLPFLFGFFLPAAQLAYWAMVESVIDTDFLVLAWNSLYLAFIAAVAAVALALIMSYCQRLHKNKIVDAAIGLSSMGYAMPGVIIAIGIIIPLAWLDHQLIDWFDRVFGIDVGLILSGSLFALVFAYCVRFLAVSLGSINSGLTQISPNIDRAAQISGLASVGILKRIHLPLMKTSILTALIIVFVDVLKELPATLILRPFDFNTLAVRTYELASDERLIDAAPASLLIVAVGIIPVILLSRSITLSQPSL